MKTLESSIQLSEVVAVGSHARQLSELLNTTLTGSDVDSPKPDKFSQVALQSQLFLEKIAQKKQTHTPLTQDELYMVGVLLTTASPKEQETVLSRVEPWISLPENEKAEKMICVSEHLIHRTHLKIVLDKLSSEPDEHTNTQARYVKFLESVSDNEISSLPHECQEALLAAHKKGIWHATLLYFNSQQRIAAYPDIFSESVRQAEQLLNQIEFACTFKTIGDVVESFDEWYEIKRKLSAIGKFFCYDETKKTYPDIFSMFISILNQVLAYDSGQASFFSTFIALPNNEQYIKKSVFKTLITTDLAIQLDFFSVHENVLKFPTEANAFLADTIKRTDTKKYYGWFFDYFADPRNQVGHESVLNQVLSKDIPKSNYSHLAHFFYYQENRDAYPELYQKVEEYLLIERNASLYQTFQGQSLESADAESQFLESKCLSALSEIADKDLQVQVSILFSRMLKRADFPVSLILATPTNMVVLIVLGYILGIEPVVVRSWQLSKQAQQSLLPSLASLCESQQVSRLFEDIIFPFNPRSEINSNPAQFEQALVEWLDIIRLFSSLPTELHGQELITNHFAKLHDLQSEYGITQVRTQLPLGYLKAVLTEIHQLKEKITSAFIGLFGIEHIISFSDLVSFFESWGGDVRSVVVLATRYANKYPEGLSLLGENIVRIIHGTYYTERYNVENPITAQQLEPLLSSGKSTEEVVSLWRDPLPTMHVDKSEVSQLKMSINDEVAEHLHDQLSQDGHNHLGILFQLPEFSSLETADLDYLVHTFTSPLSSEKSKALFDVSDLKEMFKKCALSTEKQALIIKLGQLLKSIATNTSTPEKISKNIQSLISDAKKHWPELGQTEVFQLDLGIYTLNAVSAEQNDSLGTLTTESTIMLSYITDHPKTLLEIGKYPNSTSCQNFESEGNLVNRLMGYVFDANILVSSVVEVNGSIEFTQKVMDSHTIASVSLDEGKGRARVKFEDGSSYTVNISKSRARSILMLGKNTKTGNPYIVRQKLYHSGKIATDVADKYVSDQVAKKVQQLTALGLNVETNMTNTVTTPVYIGPSHNVAGHYNDIHTRNTGSEGYTMNPEYSDNFGE